MVAKFVRVKDPADVTRCQSLGGAGQCPFQGAPDGHGGHLKYCPRHGFAEVKAIQIESSQLYQAAKWKVKIKNHADHPNVKSLREEIGILRIIIEENLEQCKTPEDLLMRQSTLSELIDKMQRLVQSGHKLEKELGVMMDKGQALRLAATLIETIKDYLGDDPVVLEMIGTQMIEEIEKIIAAGPSDL